MSDLFGDEEFDWKKEWQDMPDFFQENKQTVASVVVNFLTVDDMNKFSELVGRRITFKTKSIMYPVIQNDTKRVYVDEDDA